jgi:hypothetical protein
MADWNQAMHAFAFGWTHGPATASGDRACFFARAPDNWSALSSRKAPLAWGPLRNPAACALRSRGRVPGGAWIAAVIRRCRVLFPSNQRRMPVAATPIFPKAPPAAPVVVPVGPPFNPQDISRFISIVTNYLQYDQRAHQDDIAELGQIAARIFNGQNAA